ncbi:MAG: MFS transporter [Pseudomonadota bacterium]
MNGETKQKDRFDSLKLVSLLVLPVALAPFLLFGMLSVAIFENGLLPQYETRAQIVATGVQKRLDYGQRLFGDLALLRNIDEILDEARESSTEVAFIVVTDQTGAILAQTPDRFDGIERLIAFDESGAEKDPLELITHTLNETYERIFGEKLIDDPPDQSRKAGQYLISPLTIGDEYTPAGYVFLGTDIALLDQVRKDVTFDAITVYLAALLFGGECLLLLYAVSISRPRQMLKFLSRRLAYGDLRYTVIAPGIGRLPQLVRHINLFIEQSAKRAVRLGGLARQFLLPDAGEPKPLSRPASAFIRLPLYLFFLAEAILRPSLPVFLGDLPSPFDAPGNVQAGVAMAAFLLGSIFGVLIASKVAERLSLKRCFVFGVLLSALGTVAHIYVQGIAEAVIARGVAGLGYGVVYATAQVFLVQHTEARKRTLGFSAFLAVVVGAEITGPAIGGILADRLGAVASFAAASGAMGLAIIAASWILPSDRPDMLDESTPISTERKPLSKAAWALARNTRFVILIICFAVPSKLLLTGAIFLTIPIAVLSVDGAATDAGRVLMTYGLVILLTAGKLAKNSDRWSAFGESVFFGTFIAAVGLTLAEVIGGLASLYLCVALFGLGQSISIPSQLTFLLRVTKHEVSEFGAGPVMGMFRFYERIGSFVGPLVAAALLAIVTPAETLLILGAGSLLASGLGATYFLIVGEEDEEEAIGALLVER